MAEFFPFRARGYCPRGPKSQSPWLVPIILAPDPKPPILRAKSWEKRPLKGWLGPAPEDLGRNSPFLVSAPGSSLGRRHWSNPRVAFWKEKAFRENPTSGFPSRGFFWPFLISRCPFFPYPVPRNFCPVPLTVGFWVHFREKPPGPSGGCPAAQLAARCRLVISPPTGILVLSCTRATRRAAP